MSSKLDKNKGSPSSIRNNGQESEQTVYDQFKSDRRARLKDYGISAWVLVLCITWVPFFAGIVITIVGAVLSMTVLLIVGPILLGIGIIVLLVSTVVCYCGCCTTDNQVSDDSNKNVQVNESPKDNVYYTQEETADITLDDIKKQGSPSRMSLYGKDSKISLTDKDSGMFASMPGDESPSELSISLPVRSDTPGDEPTYRQPLKSIELESPKSPDKATVEKIEETSKAVERINSFDFQEQNTGESAINCGETENRFVQSSQSGTIEKDSGGDAVCDNITPSDTSGGSSLSIKHQTIATTECLKVQNQDELFLNSKNTELVQPSVSPFDNTSKEDHEEKSVGNLTPGITSNLSTRTSPLRHQEVDPGRIRSPASKQNQIHDYSSWKDSASDTTGSVTPTRTLDQFNDYSSWKDYDENSTTETPIQAQFSDDQHINPKRQVPLSSLERFPSNKADVDVLGENFQSARPPSLDYYPRHAKRAMLFTNGGGTSLSKQFKYIETE